MKHHIHILNIKSAPAAQRWGDGAAAEALHDGLPPCKGCVCKDRCLIPEKENTLLFSLDYKGKP